MGVDTEWPRGMELDVTVAEPWRLAPGHTEFGGCQFQFSSHPNSGMVSTHGQSQREAFRELLQQHAKQVMDATEPQQCSAGCPGGCLHLGLVRGE